MARKTVLVLALEDRAMTQDDMIIFDVDSVRDQCRNFNLYGYRVLMGTIDGIKLLEDPRQKKTGLSDINYPVPINNMSDDVLANVAALYIITPHQIDVEELDRMPQMNKLLAHFRQCNKVIAVHTQDGNRILNPRVPSEIWCSGIDERGFAAPYLGEVEFTRSVMDLIALQTM